MKLRRLIRPVFFCFLAASLASCGAMRTMPQNVTSAQTQTLQPAAIPYAAAPISWSTWGFNRQRTGYNPYEKTISPSNASGLVEKWAYAIPSGAHIDTQPIIIAGIMVNGVSTTVAFIGDEIGNFYAVNADKGTLIWKRTLGRTYAETAGCGSLSDGISSAATFDAARNRVYVVDGAGVMWAFNPATGAQSPGFPPLQVFAHPKEQHTWSGLLLSPDTNTIYYPVASHCDQGLYYGSVNAVDADTQHITTFNTVVNKSVYHGNGVWGWGGETMDPNNGNLYAGVGDSLGSIGETGRYSDSIIAISPKMTIVGTEQPESNLAGNLDIGTTPTLYDDQGFCVAFQRKDGNFFTISRYHMTNGKYGSKLALGGELAGPAYDPVTHALYAAPPKGLVRLNVGAGCTATVAWQTPMVLRGYTVPVVANGVVYVTADNVAFAVDAVSGAKLWSSKTLIGANVAAAPTIVNGTLYISAWDGKLYAFGLPAAAAR